MVMDIRVWFLSKLSVQWEGEDDILATVSRLPSWDLPCFLCRASSPSRHPGTHLSDSCPGSCSLEECGIPGTPASSEETRPSLLTLLRDQMQCVEHWPQSQRSLAPDPPLPNLLQVAGQVTPSAGHCVLLQGPKEQTLLLQ